MKYALIIKNQFNIKRMAIADIWSRIESYIISWGLELVQKHQRSMEANEVLRRMPWNWVRKHFIEFYVTKFIFTRSSKKKICLKKNELHPTHLYLYQVLQIGMLSLHCEVDKESWQIKIYFPTLQGPVNHATEDGFNTCRISDDYPNFFSWMWN